MKSLKVHVEIHQETKTEAVKDHAAMQDYVEEALAYWNRNRWKHRDWRSYGT